MVEPTGHCPYLGLKQNRAIRFASPTPEHRCYVSGEPLDIPVDQSSYCLSQGHVHCPLYMGLSAPTTNDTPTVIGGEPAAPAGGVRGWFATLPPRDRLIYAIMIAMLAIIVAIYLIVGLPTILGILAGPGAATSPTEAPATTLPATEPPPTEPPTEPPTAIPPTSTDLPTRTPEPTATAAPTQLTVIIYPTATPTQPPTSAPTQVSIANTPSPAPQATAAAPSATSRPAATARPPATPRPTQAPPQPTQAPPANVTSQALTLYFGDATGTLYVPVRRNATVEDNRVAEAAIRELIAGPRNGLGRLVPNDVELLGITIADGIATANFNRAPSDDGERGFDSIVLTLTEFTTIRGVQFQVNGGNLGGARGRPIVNPINPDNLPDDKGATEYLPIYFPSIDSAHDIRFIRMVPKTRQTAEGTVRALLEGPGEYGYAVNQVIPAGTELRGIRLDNGVVTVDFTQPFAAAPDAAIRTIVESLTTLRTVGGVQFLVEGQPFADGRVFRRPAINQE